MITRVSGLGTFVLLCLIFVGTAFAAQAAPWALSTGFEAPDYVLGGLAGQNGWATSGTAVVEDTQVHAGAQAVEVTSGSLAWLDVGTTVTAADKIVWVQSFCKTTPVNEYPELPAPAGASCILTFHATDGLMCLNGDNLGSGTWVSAGVAVTTWSLVAVRQNYTAHTWDLYIDDALVLQNLGNAYATTNFEMFECKAGGNGSMFLDNFQAAPESALPPGMPALVSPANGASLVPITVKLDWTDTARTANYSLFFWTGSTKPATATLTVSGGVSQYQPPTALAFETVYHWQVVANGTGGSTAGPEWSFTTMPMPIILPPGNVLASDNTFTDKVTITWDAVTSGSFYQVSRADTLAGAKTVIAPWQAALTFDDTTAVPGTVYYYFVQAAADAAGAFASDYSTPDTGERSETPPWTPSPYKISYKGCQVTQNGSYGLTVNVLPGAKGASLKIQKLTKSPKSTLPRPGAYFYLMSFPGFLEVDINGNRGKFYTDCPMRDLVVTGSLASLSGKNAVVENVVATGAVTSIKLASLQNGVGATPAFSTMSIVTGGAAASPLSVSLIGTVIENVTTAQTVTTLASGSKAFKTKTSSGIAVGGIGRITTDAQSKPADSFVIQVGATKTVASKGSTIAPDKFVSTGNVASISAAPGKTPTGTIGGFVGVEGGAVTSTFIANNIGTISGGAGVHGMFVAGADGAGAPAYTGAIGAMTAKTGTLTGDVYLSPASAASLKISGTSTLVIHTAP